MVGCAGADGRARFRRLRAKVPHHRAIEGEQGDEKTVNCLRRLQFVMVSDVDPFGRAPFLRFSEQRPSSAPQPSNCDWSLDESPS